MDDATAVQMQIFLSANFGFAGAYVIRAVELGISRVSYVRKATSAEFGSHTVCWNHRLEELIYATRFELVLMQELIVL